MRKVKPREGYPCFSSPFLLLCWAHQAVVPQVGGALFSPWICHLPSTKAQISLENKPTECC